MKKVIVGVLLLAALGAACAKAGAEAPAPAASAVGVSDGQMKAAMVKDGVFKLTAWRKPTVKHRIQDGGGWL